MKDKNKLFLYVLLGIVLIVLVISVYSMTAGTYSQEEYQRALQSQLPDKCETPPGYTDQQWREHMSHHPDLYNECF